MTNPKLIALYLPQFHPIPENDAWWGEGFTEWTNVRKAKPLFEGHYQPRVPADLGYYDLRDASVREAQAEMARQAGVAAFCYYHYWFGGKELLERPFDEVLVSGKPDFPFCLCWANHTWSSATWQAQGRESQVLMEQVYPGEADDVAHFERLLPAFKDERYYKIDGRLVFVVYDVWAKHIPAFLKTWRRLAQEHGLPGFYFVGICDSTLTFDPDTKKRQMPDVDSSASLFQKVLDKGFDAVNSYGKRRGEMLSMGKYRSLLASVLSNYHLNWMPVRYSYPETVHGFFAPEDSWENVFPTVMPQWDRTARKPNGKDIYVKADPAAFETHLREAVSRVEHKDEAHQVIFLKSWNEWGEGNYVEPDSKYGHGWLEAIKNVLKN